MSSNSTCPADVTFEQAAARGASIAFFVCFFLYVVLYLLRHNKFTIYATKWWTWLIGNAIEGVIVGALFAEFASKSLCFFGNCFTPQCFGYNEVPVTWAVVWPITAVLYVVLRYFLPARFPGSFLLEWTDGPSSKESELRKLLGKSTDASSAATGIAKDTSVEPVYDPVSKVPMLNFH